MQLQIIRRICDNPTCGQREDFDGQHLRPEAEAALSAWVMLSKEHVLQSGPTSATPHQARLLHFLRQ